MDFFLKNLKETLEAINKLIDNNIYTVTTKRVRRCNNIKSSNRSKINFIWRSLKYLEEENVLERNGESTPLTYKISPEEKIEIKKVIEQISERRNNNT
ncbi:MAG: hypothetical protein ACOC4M_10010 [Promethearchaeia archaeon]